MGHGGLTPTRWPVAALLALAVLVTCELATRLIFVPAVVSADTWNRYYPAYDSGFTEAGVCHPDGADEVCLKTPYMFVSYSRFPRVKPRDEIRVFVVGTSPSFGYSKALGHLMQKRHPGSRVRVVNLSIHGVGTARLRPVFFEATELDADAIVLHPHGTSEFKDAREREYQARLFQGLGGLMLHSQFVVVSKKWLLESLRLEGHVQPTRSSKARAKADARNPANARRYLASMAQNIGVMLDRARARDVPVLLVGRTSLPGKDYYGAEIEAAINASLQRSAREHGATYFDLSASLRKLPDLKAAFRDSVHFSPRGKRFVAHELEPAVAALLR